LELWLPADGVGLLPAPPWRFVLIHVKWVPWRALWMRLGETATLYGGLMVNVELPLGVIHEAPRHENVSGSGDIAPLFLTSALDGGKWSASRPGRFTPGKRSPVRIVEETVWYWTTGGARRGRGGDLTGRKLTSSLQKKACYKISQSAPDWGVEFSPNSTTKTEKGGLVISVGIATCYELDEREIMWCELRMVSQFLTRN
jgi:hypothetical protein